MTFTTSSINIGQTYIFTIYVQNALGQQSDLIQVVMPFTGQAGLITSVPATATSATISAGGVFGIVIGFLAFIGLIFLVRRFYMGKGHIRDQNKNQPQLIADAEEEKGDELNVVE